MDQLVLFIEGIAAIAVLASVLYLGLQIRDSSRSNRAAAVATLLNQYDSPNSVVASDVADARVFRIGFTLDGSLTDDEQTQFQVLCTQYMTVYHAAFRFYQDGILDAAHWLTFRRDLVVWTKYPGLQTLRDYYLAYFASDPEYAAELKAIYEAPLPDEMKGAFFGR